MYALGVAGEGEMEEAGEELHLSPPTQRKDNVEEKGGGGLEQLPDSQSPDTAPGSSQVYCEVLVHLLRNLSVSSYMNS